MHKQQVGSRKVHSKKQPLPSSYLFPTELVTKVKPNINSVEVHPQWSNNRHPVDDALLGAGSLWPLG
jgi:hypothetical protein